MKMVHTTGRFEYVGPLNDGETISGAEGAQEMLDSFAGAIYRAVMKPTGFAEDSIKFIVEKVEVK